jgi:hypothetical protein
MRGLGLSLLMLWVLSGTCLVHAATEVTVDWPSGEVQVQKDEPEKVPQEQMPPSVACEKENKRLRAIVETQQEIIARQQQKLQEQQAIIRHKDGVIRSLDLLRRQGR